MKKSIITLAFFNLFSILQAQQRLEIKHFCNFDGAAQQPEFNVFNPSAEAEQIVGEIVKAAGIDQNFMVKSADCKTVVACESGSDRYILINYVFLEKFKQDARTKWAAYFLLTHEICHHLLGHHLDCQNPKTCKEQELATDRFAAEVMFRMNATLEQTQVGIKFYIQDGEFALFPNRNSRLDYVTSGWKQGQKTSLQNQKIETEDATAPKKAKSKELLEKGFRETDFKKKIEIYTKAIELDPKNADAYNNRGYAKNVFGQHREAIEDFDKAIAVRPNYSMAFCNRGYTKQLLGQHAGAILDFEKAIELDPKYANNYGRKGCSLVKLGKKTEAIVWLEKGLKIDPNLSFAKDCLQEASK